MPFTYATPQSPTAGVFYVQAPKEGDKAALKGPAFVLTSDPILKFTESKFEGVDVRAI